MMIKTISCILIGLLLNLSFLQTTALAESKEHRSAKIKAGVVKLGVGKDSKVEVKLFDKTKVKGYVSEIKEEGFTVVEEKSNIEKNVLYSQVKQVKGNNLSKEVKIAVGIGIVILALIIIGILADGSISPN